MGFIVMILFICSVVFLLGKAISLMLNAINRDGGMDKKTKEVEVFFDEVEPPQVTEADFICTDDEIDNLAESLYLSNMNYYSEEFKQSVSDYIVDRWHGGVKLDNQDIEGEVLMLIGKIKNYMENKNNKAVLKYPTEEEIENLGQVKACWLYRFLRSPENPEERRLMDKLIKKHAELGGFTPKISKDIGW